MEIQKMMNKIKKIKDSLNSAWKNEDLQQVMKLKQDLERLEIEKFISDREYYLKQ